MFSSEFCKISKNTFSYRTTPVAASDIYCETMTQTMTFSFKGSFIVTAYVTGYFSKIVLRLWGGLKGGWGGEKVDFSLLTFKSQI